MLVIIKSPLYNELSAPPNLTLLSIDKPWVSVVVKVAIPELLLYTIEDTLKVLPDKYALELCKTVDPRPIVLPTEIVDAEDTLISLKVEMPVILYDVLNGSLL